MENIISSLEIRRNSVVEKLPLFLEDKKRTYAKMYVEIAMKGLLDEVQTLEDMRIFASAMNSCREFAEKNNVQELLNYCTLWNRAGVQKVQAIKAQNNNGYDMQTANHIKYQLQNFYEILTKPMKDIGAISQIIPRLNEISEMLQARGNQIFSPQDLQQIQNVISQEQEMATDIMHLSDELDEDLKLR